MDFRLFPSHTPFNNQYRIILQFPPPQSPHNQYPITIQKALFVKTATKVLALWHPKKMLRRLNYP